MKKTFLSFALDAFFIFSLFTLITAAGPFLSPELTELFNNRPKYHRMAMSLVTLANLAIIYILYYRGKLEEYSRIARSIRRIPFTPWVWTWVIFLGLSMVFSISSVLRHHVFLSSFDFAIFSQAIWNTWNGSFLYSSIKGGICLLGDHISPFLALLAPFYGLTGEPRVLLAVQAVGAASSIFPLFLIANRVLKSPKLALCFIISFATYLPLRNAVRFDFHPELLGDPLLLWAFYFILQGKLTGASIALAFALTTKETVCAPIAMLGLYSWWFQKKTLFGLSWFVIALTMFFADIKIIAPYFYGGEYFYLSGNFLEWRKLGWIAFLQHFFQGSTFTYLKKIFLPVGFLPFLSPTQFLLVVPILFQNLSSRNLGTRSTFFQYTAFLTPFVFVSAIYGFKNVLDWASRQKRWPYERVQLILIYWFLGCSFLFAGISELYVINKFLAKDNDHLAYVRRYLKTIPSNVSVRTHEFFAAHLSNRREVHIYENHHPREGASAKAMNSEYVVLDVSILGPEYQQNLEELRQLGYEPVHEHEGFFVYRKAVS